MSEPISEIAFNTLPQAIRDWIAGREWKREDITSVHIQHGKPAVFTFAVNGEKHITRLGILDDGRWANKVIEEQGEA